MPNIDTVIFDWGGVLIDDPAPLLVDYCARALGVSPQQYAAAQGLPAVEFQNGRISEQRFWELICAALRRPMPGGVSLWYEAFCACYRPKAAMWQLLRQVRDTGYKTALLSNTEMPSLLRLSPDDRQLFQAIVASCEVGLSKPDVRIYQHALQMLKSSGSQTVFIDDRLAYVEGARQAGLHTILFADPPSTLSALRELGVKV